MQQLKSIKKASLRAIISAALSLGSFSAYSLDKIKLPGEVCANGEDYSYFHSVGDKDSKTLVIEFMGGGVCWDQESCEGNLKERRAITWPVKKLRAKRNFLRWLPKESKRPHLIFISYCTADLHLGKHTASYNNETVEHSGLSIAKKVLEISHKIFKEQALENLITVGVSAGGLGLLGHLSSINETFTEAKSKLAIIDSPGLFWPKDSLKKFPKQMQKDIETGLKISELDKFEDIIARTCSDYSQWKLSFLFSERDWIMSKVFADITPIEYSKRLRDPLSGLKAQVSSFDNCSSWQALSKKHAHLVMPSVIPPKDEKGETTLDFITPLISPLL